MQVNRCELAIGIVIYFVLSLAGLALVKFVNYYYCWGSWLLVALCSRGTWLLSIIFHFLLLLGKRQDEAQAPLPRNPWPCFWLTWRQAKIYLAMGAFLSLVEMLNATTMNILPGSLYALIKGSDVPCSMILSFLLLKKRYKTHQIVGVVIVTLGITGVFICLHNQSDDRDDSSREEQEDTDDPSWPAEHGMSESNHTTIADTATTPDRYESSISQWMASILCVVSAMLNAACSVLTEKFLKATLKEEEEKTLASTLPSHTVEDGSGITLDKNSASYDRSAPTAPPSKLLLTNIYSMTTSGVSFSVIILWGMVTGEFFRLPSLENHCLQNSGSKSINTDDNQLDDDTTADRVGETATAVIVAALFLIVATRFGERLAKHWICAADSAMTFSLVQVFRRLSGVFILGLLFLSHESAAFFDSGAWMGAVVCSIGFVVHADAMGWWRGGVVATETGTSPGNTQQYELVPTSNANTLR